MKSIRVVLRPALLLVLIVPGLIACGDGGGSSTNASAGTGNGGNNSNSNSWTPGVFLPASTYDGHCAVPVPGSGTVQGTRTDENNFLRSYSNDTYLWYDEIVDRDPSLYSTPVYFEFLKTEALTPSGNPKDQFHFTVPTEEWLALSQAGISVGYGAQFTISQAHLPSLVVIAYTEPGTPATAAGLERGAEILSVDGVDLFSGGDPETIVETINAGLFPESAGESHTFEVRDQDGTEREIIMVSAEITSSPVQSESTIATAGGDVGYLLFNDHIATSEKGLFDAVTFLATEGITDLVLDIRYNGGGFLAIASELAYMIAGAVPTAGRDFEAVRFNDKHPNINPVTGETLIPFPFFTHSLGIDPSLAAGTPLPTLDMARVYVITGPNTCSASESIINSLRGVDVEVIQIGSTTCGKPYGFYPTDNCGTTYFTIQFQGVNAKGFGDYADGFSPANSIGDIGTVVPGCSVGDDFSELLGDPDEARLAAALAHIDSGICPAPSGIAVHGVSSLSLPIREELQLTKSIWQINRIMWH